LADKATIQLYRADGKLGVDFDSPQTLSKFLAFIRWSKNTRSSVYIPILENGGVIPREDPKFQALLKRLGIMDFDIPNNLRAVFLVDFLQFERSLAMDLTWWERIPRDRKVDFQTYLEKRQIPQISDDRQTTRERELIKLVILPLLQADGEFNPYNVEIELAQAWDMTVGQMLTKFHDLWLEMVRLWTVREVAKHLGKKPRTIQNWASTGQLFGEKGRRGHWYFTHEVLIDYEAA
jgi:hypothetical protein